MSKYECFKAFGVGRETVVDGIKTMLTGLIHPRSGRKYGLVVQSHADGTVTCNPHWFMTYLKHYIGPNGFVDIAAICEANRRMCSEFEQRLYRTK